MNETITSIRERRSIRSYTDKPITKEDLEQLVDCGRLAPSAMNVQPWKFVVVTKKDTLQKLSDVATYGKFIKSAAACIVVCADTTSKFCTEDCSAATQNILVAAKALGIGSCWVAGKPHPYCEKVKDLLEIPSPFEIGAIIPLGYPKGKPLAAPEKKEFADVISWEQF